MSDLGLSDLGTLLPAHRIRVEATLEVLSPLHLGTGGREAGILRPADPGDPGSSPDLSLACRDADGQPYLPGPSLKGLLRRLAPAGAADGLFGTIKGPNGTGRMGSVTVWGARCITLPNATEAPHAGELAGKGRAGAFANARTRIDGDSGTAAHNKLFFQEMVPPGTEFRLRLLVQGETAEAARTALADLAPALAALASGASLGKGQADGQGRVRLKPGTVRATRLSLGADGTLAEKAEPFTLPKAMPRPVAGRWTLALRCEGPFLVKDGSHQPPRGERDQRAADRNDPALSMVKGQRLGRDRPLLPGTSLMGALKARAAWLCALSPPAMGAEALLGLLFGDTGRRGLLLLETLELGTATPWNVTSVRLDRFSGAPMDGALFTGAAFVDVSATATLVLDQRPGLTAEALAAAKTMVGVLLKSLEAEGLMLGHGTNRGFGWFEVSEAGAAGGGA